jgi:hypothetical protein
MVKLKPHFYRVALYWAIGWAMGAFLISLSGSYMPHRYWWTLMIISLPFGPIPLILWFVSVPAVLEFSDTRLTIRWRFRRQMSLSWDNLKSYDVSFNSLNLQFVGKKWPFQIFSPAYPKAAFRQFPDFLQNRFPEKKRRFASPWASIKKMFVR